MLGDSAALGAQASFKAQLYAALFARAAMGSEAANQPIFGSQDGSDAQRPLFVAITFCWPEALIAPDSWVQVASLGFRTSGGYTFCKAYF